MENGSDVGGEVIKVGGAGKVGMGWKVGVIVLSVVVLGLGGVLVWKMLAGGGEKKAEESGMVIGEEEEGDDVASSGDGAIWKSYKTEKMGIGFDYPEGWVVKSSASGSDEVVSVSLTTVTSPKGLELRLSENVGGGIGGTCGDDEDEIVGFFRREADVPGVDGLSVVSTESEGKMHLVVSWLSGLGAGRSLTCAESFFYSVLSEVEGLEEWDFQGEGPFIVNFTGIWDEITSDEEFEQAVKVLASFRQE